MLTHFDLENQNFDQFYIKNPNFDILSWKSKISTIFYQKLTILSRKKTKIHNIDQFCPNKNQICDLKNQNIDNF